ncbi:MAG: His/Gly/Thr/Pro-type tRNA ligase C-terminal domain-containing protein, partial [Candidatus Omnitrophota bacterium]|nr:His/Gly/Thr/Pro-type tRNA ligase C-terminal domain-containing protein [Candidatus Omnitrophota bacterium]
GIDYEGASLKSQMRTADKLGAKSVLIIGDDEVRKGEAVLRNMAAKEQFNIKFGDIIKTISKICSNQVRQCS